MDIDLKGYDSRSEHRIDIDKRGYEFWIYWGIGKSLFVFLGRKKRAEIELSNGDLMDLILDLGTLIHEANKDAGKLKWESFYSGVRVEFDL